MYANQRMTLAGNSASSWRFQNATSGNKSVTGSSKPTSTTSSSLGPLRPLRGSLRSGNLTPSAQANITILPLRPPTIHRTPLATLLRNAHFVRGICPICRPIQLLPHPNRNRGNFGRKRSGWLTTVDSLVSAML